MSNQILGSSSEEWRRVGATHTATEIYNQPELWIKTWDLVSANAQRLSEFLRWNYQHDDLQIILTGAGTSAYIGEVLEGIIQRSTKFPTRAIPTTHLVTHPALYILKDKPTLLISFARSGDSPESIKAVELADQISDKVNHLIITCNADGKLAKSLPAENNFVFILPPEANDKGLAMTGSFSSMLLTGLLIAKIEKLPFLEQQKRTLYEYGNFFFNTYIPELKKIASMEFERAVFLGSGLFGGIATESHLKMQELTGGKVICTHDSFLGFRHGPKAVVNGNTLLTYIFSNDHYSQKYEIDLVASINSDRSKCYSIGVMEHDINKLDLDCKIILSSEKKSLDEDFLPVVSILPAQVLSLFKSISLGLQPDTPSENDIITRVVEGVHLYEYNAKPILV